MASSDGNGGRGFAVDKTTPSFFPRNENMLSQKFKIFLHPYRTINFTYNLALSSAFSALCAIVR